MPILRPNSGLINVTKALYEITSIADKFKRIWRVASQQQNTWLTNYIRVLKIPVSGKNMKIPSSIQDKEKDIIAV